MELEDNSNNTKDKTKSKFKKYPELVEDKNLDRTARTEIMEEQELDKKAKKVIKIVTGKLGEKLGELDVERGNRPPWKRERSNEHGDKKKQRYRRQKPKRMK